MDENFRKSINSDKECKKSADDETIRKTEGVADLILKSQSDSRVLKSVTINDTERSCRSGSSFDVSGPSVVLPASTYEVPEVDLETDSERDSPAEESPVPSTAGIRSHVRIANAETQQNESRKNSIGPPPSYSFVMKEKRQGQNLPPLDIVTNRPPPPAYAGIRGLYTPQPFPSHETDEPNRMCLLPSFSEPIWRSHSQPAFCPRCGILILTTTHAHESVATHVAALALCLFGCWPCCFLPYCMNVCKNTHHHCPVCQTYLGSYTPW